MFHNNTTQFGDGGLDYYAQEDALRIKVVSMTILEFQEKFLNLFDEITHYEITMIRKLVNRKVSIPTQIDRESIMHAQFKEKLLNLFTANIYA